MSDPHIQLPVEIEDRLWSLHWLPSAERLRAAESLFTQHPQHADAMRALLHGMDRIDAEAAAPPTPTQIGPFHLLRELGHGGMGQVFLAERREPVLQQVAIKLIKRGMDTDATVSRFHQERRLLARMQHDAIAKVFDCGATASGQLFFVMEYVPGTPLTRYCDDRRLTIRARIELFQKVCAAVQHAHSKFVIHRDLKPGNILVAELDGAPVPKVIDFGLAMAFGQDADARISKQGVGVGTPLYMAPEQAAGRPDVDVRADVYSLGVILYELLSGCLPVGEREISQWLKGDLGARDTPRPSSRLGGDPVTLARAAEDRRISGSSLQRLLAQDLDWVVVRAVTKEPDRRYPTPAALAEDLQRYLDGVPVLAGPPSQWNVVRKFARRHRGRLTAAVMVLATALAGTSWAAVERGKSQASVAYRMWESAQRAAGAGEWDTAATGAEAAVAAGHGPAEELLLKATEFWLAASHRGRARASFDLLPEAASNAGSHRRRMMALELQPASADAVAAAAAALVNEAQAAAATNLSKADQAFLLGLAAAEPEEALRQVQVALDLEPRHVLANHALLPLLLFTGRTDQVADASQRQMVLFPLDAAPRFAEVVARTLMGDQKGARDKVESLAQPEEREIASAVCDLVAMFEQQLAESAQVLADAPGAKETVRLPQALLRTMKLVQQLGGGDELAGFRLVPSLVTGWRGALWSAAKTATPPDPVLACLRIAKTAMDMEGLLATEDYALRSIGQGLFGKNPQAHRSLLVSLIRMQGHMYVQRQLDAAQTALLQERIARVAMSLAAAEGTTLAEFRLGLSTIASVNPPRTDQLIAIWETRQPAGDPWPNWFRAKLLSFDMKNAENMSVARWLLDGVLVSHPDFEEAKKLRDSLTPR